MAPEFYKGLYISDRLWAGKADDQFQRVIDKIQPQVGMVMMVIWGISKSRKKREVSVGVVTHVGSRFLSLEFPQYNAGGEPIGTTSFSILLSDILCGEVRVMRLGQIQRRTWLSRRQTRR